MDLVFGYIAAGFMGITLGLIGAGGSILTVPILVFLMGVDPIIATAYSLFVVGVSAAIASAQYARKKLIDYRAAMIFAAPSIIAVFSTRKYLVPALPDVIYQAETWEVTKDQFILGLFAVVILIAAISMLTRKTSPKVKEQIQQKKKDPEPKKLNYFKIMSEGLVVGFLTGLVGAGGGFLIIPALVLLTGMSMKLAVGTSLFIIAAKSLIGFLGDIGNQELDWGFLLTFTSISVVGIVAGVFLSTKVEGQRLKQGFGYFLLVMSIYMAIKIF